MPPPRSLVVVLMLAASLVLSLSQGQEDRSRNSDFTFGNTRSVLASRVAGGDLTRPGRRPLSRRLGDYHEGSPLGYRDEREPHGPGADSVGLPLKKRAVGCPDDSTYMCQSGDRICGVQVCNGILDCPDRDDEMGCDVYVVDALDTSGRSCPGDSTYTCVSGDTICGVNVCDGTADCPGGDDEEDCECGSDQFLCDTTTCLSINVLCDGIPDCVDGTDEQDCSQTCAWPRNFTCSDGTCAARCDGIQECPDNADEENCPTTTTTTTTTSPTTQTTTNTPTPITTSPTTTSSYPGCGAGQWQCRDGFCIYEKNRCNGCVNCFDGSDEEGCPPRCRRWQFRCEDGSCIYKGFRCNGRRDCRDGSDERHCGHHGHWHRL